MHATNLSNEFAKRDYSVDILVTKELSENVFFRTHENVHIVSIQEYNQNNSNSYQRKKVRRQIKRLKRCRYLTRRLQKLDTRIEQKIRFLRKGDNLRDWFIKADPDIVIPFGLSYLEPTLSAVQGLKCKVFYAEKNAPEKEFPKKESESFSYLIKLLRSINGVIVQTQNSKMFFDNNIPNIFVINNPIKQDLPLPYNGKRRKAIVNFCRMSPQKNLDLLIEAFLKIHDKYSDYTLEIYGNTVEESEEQYKQRILRKIHNIGLEESVTVFPPAADVHQRILDSAMFVSSSDYEGLSNSMIEAMAIGLPCICTDCLGGGTREVMVDGENGLIVPMNNVDAMYMAMKRFIEAPECAVQCGNNASKIREKLSVEKIAKQWMNVFQR